MGTLASAEFLRTLYEENPAPREQDAPRCILHSDPGFPDRSEAILSGESAGIPERLTSHLTLLQKAGATRMVMGCVTLHHFLPEVPEGLRRHVISLVDLIVDAVASNGEAHLLICTLGTRSARIFERHARWPEIETLIRLPSPEEQKAVHEMLYRAKAKPVQEGDLMLLDELRIRYDVDTLIAGCTEMHLVHGVLRRRPDATPYEIEDPLFRIAQNLESFLGA
jgi:aspartate racemase